MNKLQLTYTENFQSISITASIGISFIPKHGMTFEEIYMKADKALYLSKEHGKSTFCLISVCIAISVLTGEFLTSKSMDAAGKKSSGT